MSMKEIPYSNSGCQKNENLWKSLGCIMVKWSPSESPAAKTLGACGPLGFGLGTYLGTLFTMIPVGFSADCPTIHYTIHNTLFFMNYTLYTVNYTLLHYKLYRRIWLEELQHVWPHCQCAGEGLWAEYHCGGALHLC